ncbi:MerR family transcriptional regulator [Agarilytica rhodophyticola]|uniref:MerR family transcriptional regulator n=1 Tax=Agarilytica rhodophyticola TaxID=1737490 RepID=UPI000B346D92|nr:MerR family transcriptional regulator [Agarilytica rhodophyticola]
MRIGDLAERTGVSLSTIRFYERNGLISSIPSESETNNYRQYPEENILLLQFLTKAREAGMSVADLKSLMSAIGNGCDEVHGRKVVEEKIAELKERATQIQKVIEFLEGQLAAEKK